MCLSVSEVGPCLYADGTNTGEGEEVIIPERGLRCPGGGRVELGKTCCMGTSVGLWSGTGPP